MPDPFPRMNHAAQALRALDPRLQEPFVGIVLGSGLGDVVGALDDPRTIPYDAIPGFPGTTVAGHHGQLVIGRLEGRLIVACQGRAHLYEGHDPDTVVHPVRTLCALGASALLLTNAAGGVNRSFVVGELMLLSDHVNLTGRNPLFGANDDRLGLRFPDMTAAYDPSLRLAFRVAAEEARVPLQEGVYFGLLGPSYETPAEIRMIRTLGADAVGMSTVLETIAARHMGCRVVGISVISNAAAGDAAALDHSEVKEAADRAAPGLLTLLRGVLRSGAFDKETA